MGARAAFWAVTVTGLKHGPMWVLTRAALSCLDETGMLRWSRAKLAHECRLDVRTLDTHLPKLNKLDLLRPADQGFRVVGWLKTEKCSEKSSEESSENFSEKKERTKERKQRRMDKTGKGQQQLGGVGPLLYRIYREHCGDMQPCLVLTPDRLRRSNALAAEEHDVPALVERFRQAVERAARSPFCTGQGGRKWKASFDWFIRDGNSVARVLEGQYDDLRQTSDGRNGRGSGASQAQARERRTEEAGRRAAETVFANLSGKLPDGID